MSDNRHKGEPGLGIESSFLDGIRQWCFPPEYRIAAPRGLLQALEMAEAKTKLCPPAQPVRRKVAPGESHASNELVADLATCLWYLKTRHFNRRWEDDGTGEDDPRVRRALGRLNKGIEALKEAGIEVDDPTNKRYPQGGEGLMRPIQFQPTAGVTFEMVSETVTPVIYRDDRLIQRGEVFVAVPPEQTLRESAPPVNATTSDDEEVHVTDKSSPQEPEALAAVFPTEMNCGSAEATEANDDAGTERPDSKQVAGDGGEEAVVADDKSLGDVTSSEAAKHATAAAEAYSETVEAEGESDSKQEPKTKDD